jgi:hypothetical protein
MVGKQQKIFGFMQGMPRPNLKKVVVEAKSKVQIVKESAYNEILR